MSSVETAAANFVFALLLSLRGSALLKVQICWGATLHAFVPAGKNPKEKGTWS